MNLVERLFGRTKRAALEEMILIFEEEVKPEMETYIAAIAPVDQAIAEGTMKTVESLMLSRMVQKMIKPPEIKRNDIRRQIPLGKLNVTLQ